MDLQNMHKLCRGKIRTDEHKVGNVLVFANRVAHTITRIFDLGDNMYDVGSPITQYWTLIRQNGVWYGMHNPKFISGPIKESIELFCNPPLPEKVLALTNELAAPPNPSV